MAKNRRNSKKDRKEVEYEAEQQQQQQQQSHSDSNTESESNPEQENDPELDPEVDNSAQQSSDAESEPEPESEEESESESEEESESESEEELEPEQPVQEPKLKEARQQNAEEEEEEVEEEEEAEPEPEPKVVKGTSGSRKRARRDSGSASGSRPGNFKRVWTEEDELVILKGVLAFKERTGDVPRGDTMPLFFESIKNSLHLEPEGRRFYEKVRHLRHKFVDKLKPNHKFTGHYLRCFELAQKAWSKKKNVDSVRQPVVSVAEPTTPMVESSHARQAGREYLMQMLPDCVRGSLLLIDRERLDGLESKAASLLAQEMSVVSKRYELLSETCNMIGNCFDHVE